MIVSIVFAGKKPPEDMIVIDKLKASNILTFMRFKTINKKNVNEI